MRHACHSFGGVVLACVAACDCVGRVSAEHPCARTERAWPKQKHRAKQFKCAISAWQYVLWSDSVVWVERALRYVARGGAFLMALPLIESQEISKKKRISILIEIFFVYRRAFGSVHQRATARGQLNKIHVAAISLRQFSASQLAYLMSFRRTRMKFRDNGIELTTTNTYYGLRCCVAAVVQTFANNSFCLYFSRPRRALAILNISTFRFVHNTCCAFFAATKEAEINAPVRASRMQNREIK